VARTIGAIDIGTNSLHLMVAELRDDGSFRILTREKETIRLGSGGGDMKHLSSSAMDRGIEALGRFRHIAEQWNAELTALATSAVREARNRSEFLTRARLEAGVDVEIISGIEEARLIHLGVLQAVPVGDRRHLVVDIGGGSTEFIVGDGTTPLLLRSMKLGAIRLTDRFFPGGVTSDDSVDACRHYIRGFLTTAASAIVDLDPKLAIACSGTAETLASLCGSSERLDATDLAAITATLVATRRPERRMTKLGVDERRSDIIAAGAVLLDEITRSLDVETWHISQLALREGIVFDLASRAKTADALHRLNDLRRQSVITVAERYKEDVDHAEHITDLVLELFDATVEIHRLGTNERDILEAAALLHNIGLYVAHSAHHRHSYYLIRNTEQLAGFTEHETELMAQVARYHRKSAPKPKHSEWAALSTTDQATVEMLAALLRVGIGLDRGDRSIIQRVEVDVAESSLTIRARTRPGVDADLEIYSASSRATLLAKLTGREVTVVAEPDESLLQAHPSQQ